MNYTEEMKSVIAGKLSARSWTGADFERATKIPHASVQRIIKGVDNGLKDDHAEKICSVFGIDPVAFWMLSRGMITKEQLLSGANQHDAKGAGMTIEFSDPRVSSLCRWMAKQPSEIVEVIEATAKIHGYGAEASKMARAG